MTKPDLTNSWAAVLAAAKKHHNELIENGLADPARLKLTAPARAEIVKERKAQGASNRQIAAELDVDESTIRADLRGNPAKSAGKVRIPYPLNLKLATVPAQKRYGTIVIDPPWEMEKIKRDQRPLQVAFDYRTMTEDELAEFPVDAMAAEDCHLFCWTTQKHLPTALKLLPKWGFKYTLLMTWHKPGGFQPHGLPQFNSEFAIYARCGNPKFRETTAFNTCFQGARREHSRKPDEFYNTLRRVTADGRIDVFSREKREGFDQYGNETGKFADAVQA